MSPPKPHPRSGNTNTHLLVLRTQLAALHGKVKTRRWKAARAGALRYLKEIEHGGPALVARVQEDANWVAALLVRAEWQLGPARSRSSRFEQAYYLGLKYAPDLTLRQILDIHRDSPPQAGQILYCWAEQLCKPMGWWAMYHPAHARLLREAVHAGLTAADLEMLTRKYPGVHARLAWIERLEEDGHLAKAIEVARAGDSIPYYFAEQQDILRVRLGALYVANGQEEQAQETWQRTWTEHISTQLLCQLWCVAGTAAPDFFRSVLEQAYNEEAAVPSDIQTRIEILLGDIDLPLARLQAASLEGWWLTSDGHHPLDIVLPLLLRLGTGQAQLSPDLELSRSWRSTNPRDNRNTWLKSRVQTRWSDLVDEVISTHHSWLVDAPTWRASATRVISEMMDTAFSARASKAYGRLASALVSLTEAGTIASDPNAKAVVQSILRRYPRHRAVRRLVEEMWSHSPIFDEDI